MKAKAYLEHLLKLLQIEKDEDLKLYQKQVLDQSLSDRVKKGISWYPVSFVRMFIGLGERLVVELECKEEPSKSSAFQVGGIVSVFGMVSDQELGRVNGVVASIRKKIIRIALNLENIPDWLHHTRLGIDLAFDDKTYKEMERAVRTAIEPEKNVRLAELREILLGPAKPNFHKWDVYYHNKALNESQNQAVQRALEAKDVAIIHGPPGTGKTTTMVAVIAETVRREHQVLVCAPSNTAVDLLTLKCIQAGLNVVRLGNPVRVDEALQGATLDGTIAAHDDYQALRKLRKDAESVRKTALKFKRNFGPEQRKRRNELLKEARELKGLAHQLEDYILFQVLHRAEVITSTLSGAASSILSKKHFHTVFIDEAGQALAPACWIPILRSGRVIMAGDHCQLPPTVKSLKADRGGLSKTLFESVIEEKPECSVMLNQQYRMHEQIMTFSGRFFYDDQLKADPSVQYWQLGSDFAPLEFVDTAGCGFEEQQNPQTLSTANPDEANLLLRHLAVLFNQIEKEAPSLLEQGLSIGIISPYKAQVQTLNQQIQGSPMLSAYGEHIRVKTVDGFQGQECDIIYISLTRSNSKNEIGFLKDTRRMNVALTRARKKLVVIGDSATLGAHPFYAAFLQYAEEMGAYHSAWEWMYQE